MNLQQLDDLKDHVQLDINRGHLVFYGINAYPPVADELKKVMEDFSFEILQPKRLILPAFEYRGILCCMSHALPPDAMMVCEVDKEEVQIQKELIGWPL